jgi:hypothetical protein
MATTLPNIAVDQIAEELTRRGFAPNQRVTVTVDESLSEIARRASEEAERRGLTDEIFRKLMQDE